MQVSSNFNAMNGIQDMNRLFGSIGKGNNLQIRYTKVGDVNRYYNGVRLSFSRFLINTEIQRDSRYNIAKGDRRYVIQGYDLMEKQFGNERFTARFSADGDRNERVDQHIIKPDHSLLVKSQIGRSDHAIVSHRFQVIGCVSGGAFYVYGYCCSRKLNKKHCWCHVNLCM